MKFDKETRPEGVSSLTAEVIAEAMPWIKNITGKTVVIKYGGSAMVDEQLRADVMADIVLLKIIGMNPVIVHGGGIAISEAMRQAELPVEFVDGQRVTTPEAMEVVRTILTGKVNQELVQAMNQHGSLAVGISGADAGTILAEQASPQLGRVGNVTDVNNQLILDLVNADYIPVIASIAMGDDGGCYNINADKAAGRIASAIGAHKIIYLTDVDGLFKDFSDKSTLIADMTSDEAQKMIDEKSISTGMIPKLESCVRCLAEGVHRAHILNGTTPHALLLELLTDHGIGTMVRSSDESEAVVAAPLGNFASKLVNNW